MCSIYYVYIMKIGSSGIHLQHKRCEDKV
uniref:Uncharacterized protein n=1 Tax=Arundo donax TaxID=35708 RepID=A0A0A9EL48_ARUDO